eukprot:COSAG06_NODE_64903_length_258_cov_0.654088_1_plen_32_part_10
MPAAMMAVRVALLLLLVAAQQSAAQYGPDPPD